MAGLQADELNDKFLRSFIQETLYLVPGDDAVPAVQAVIVQEPVIEVKEHVAENIQKTEVPGPSRIETDEVLKPEVPVRPSKYIVTGQNKKGVVVLVTLPDASFKQLPQLQLLQKMLSAIGFTPEDVAYVNNVSGEIAIYEELQQLLPVKYIISFASRLTTVLPHDKFTLYNPVKVGDTPVVFSQSLEVLEQDVEHKKKLWAVFQQVFL